MDQSVELWRHRCGGSKRPCALHTSRESWGIVFAFAFSSGSRALEVHTAGDAPGIVHKAIQPALHGREVHSVAWLSPPALDSAGLLVSGSEDTLLRLTRCAFVKGRVTLEPVQPALHYQGAVRALTVVQGAALGAGLASVVVSAGAKCTLRAHLLEGTALRQLWEAPSWTMGSPGGGLEERVMAVDCCLRGLEVLVAAVTSSGYLRLWRQSWRAWLSTETSDTSEAVHSTRVTEAVGLCVRWAPGDVVLSGSADGVLIGHRIDERSLQVVLREEAHEAGINDIATLYEGPESWLVCTAGDDQCIWLARLSSSCALLATLRIENAHASSIRAATWAGNRLLSLGYDRRLSAWEVSTSDSSSLCLSLAATTLTCCTEPLALASTSVGEAYIVALAGRGLALAVLRS